MASNDTPLEEYRGYARDVALVTGAQLAVALLHFARLPILTKLLGATLYGTWSLILVTVSLIMPVAMLGLGVAMIRFLAAEKERPKIADGFFSVLFVVLATGAIISLAMVLCSNPFAVHVLGDIGNAAVARLAAFMVLSQALSQIGMLFFRTFRWVKLYSAFLLGKAVLELGLMVCFLLQGWELEGLVLAVLSGGILSTLISVSIVIARVGYRFPSFAHLKDYLRYGLPLVPSRAILWIIISSDRYLIKYLIGIREVGVYAAACTLVHPISLFLAPIQAVLLPTISKTFDQADTQRTRTYLKYSIKYLMMVSIPAVFGLSVMAKPLLQVFTTAEFVAGSSVVPFIASGLVIFDLYEMGSHAFHLVKKTHWVLRLLLVSAVLNVGLNLVLIPRMGIVGAAVATLIAYSVLGILTVVVAFRYFRFDLGLPFIAKSVASSVVMAFVIFACSPIGTTKVVLAILLGMAVYAAMLFALKGLSKTELALLKDLIHGFMMKKR